MTGLNKYNEKQRRAQRRRNHIARDVATTKYHQRVIEGRKRYGDDQECWFDDKQEYEQEWDD